MISEKWGRVCGICRTAFWVELLGVLSESEFTEFTGFSELHLGLKCSWIVFFRAEGADCG